MTTKPSTSKPGDDGSYLDRPNGDMTSCLLRSEQAPDMQHPSLLPYQLEPRGRGTQLSPHIPPVRRSASVSDAQRYPYPRLSSYPSSSSERRAVRNLERDPTWVPRPPNAFIIFRAEYSRVHASGNSISAGFSSAPPPDKSLSKRAAEAWKELSAEERSMYKWRAEQERIEHAKAYPDYRYKPRRKQKDMPGAQALSRREQVESFMRRAESRSLMSSESDVSGECPSPPSFNSSSPEIPSTPFSLESPLEGPSFSFDTHLPPAEGQHLYPDYLLPSAPDHALPSSRTVRPGFPTSYSADMINDMYTPEYTSPAGSYPGPSIPFSLSEHSVSFTPPEVALMGQLRLEETTQPPESYSASHLAPSTPPYTPQQVQHGPLLAPTNPLYKRRARAATTSNSMPSPLTVITSTLGEWHGRCMPSFVPDSGLSILPPPPPPPQFEPSPLLLGWEAEPMGPVPPMVTRGGSNSTVRESDFDRTPRRADFPRDAQSTSIPPPYGIPDAPGYPAAPRSRRSSYNIRELSARPPTQNSPYSLFPAAPAFAPPPEPPLFMQGAGGDTNPDACMYPCGMDPDPQLESYTLGLAELGIEPLEFAQSPFVDLDFPYVTPGLFP